MIAPFGAAPAHASSRTSADRCGDCGTALRELASCEALDTGELICRSCYLRRVDEPDQGLHLRNPHECDPADEVLVDRPSSSLIDFTDIIAKPVRWAWKDRIALAKLTALAGRPKIGTAAARGSVRWRVGHAAPQGARP
jgi:hypothetical protein